MSLDILKTVVRGSAMYARLRVLNEKVSPARPYVPDGGMRITYYKPDGTIHPSVDNVAMTPVAGTMEFEFIYQSATDDPLGTWAVSGESTHQSQITKYPKHERFNLVLF